MTVSPAKPQARRGFPKLFSVFSIERLGNATMSLAIAQAALDRTIEYVQQREQFGRPLVEFQNVQTLWIGPAGSASRSPSAD